MGMFFGLRANNDSWIFSIALGGTIGLIGGILVWIIDCPSGTHPGSFAGRFAALLSLLLFWVPVLGLLSGVIAVFTNPKGTGWSRFVGWLGCGLSVFIHGAILFSFFWQGG